MRRIFGNEGKLSVECLLADLQAEVTDVVIRMDCIDCLPDGGCNFRIRFQDAFGVLNFHEIIQEILHVVVRPEDPDCSVPLQNGPAGGNGRIALEVKILLVCNGEVYF